MKMINADQITTNMNGSTLEIFIDGKLAAEISDGKTELGFVYDVLQGMDYEINEDNFVLRTINPVEELYTYKQSQQICMQTGFVGYLRADFDSNGKNFYSTWNEFNKTLKTPEFAADLDFIINEFRGKDCMFQDRDKLKSFCNMHPEWKMVSDRDYYGVRVDTTNYSYMLRFTPRQGDYNIYCHCYKKEMLDKHLETAERGIRFIDPHYNEQFKIPDGDKVRITFQDGTTADRTCRYIDDYHVEVGSQLYHICQFAEIMQNNGNEVIPLRSSLPEQCYIYLPTTKEIGIVKKGENGYYRTDLANGEPASMRDLVDSMNKKLGVTKAQAEALKSGSMFGWKVPAADPKNYDDNGKLLKPNRKNKEYER